MEDSEGSGLPSVELRSHKEICSGCQEPMGDCPRGYVHRNHPDHFYHRRCGRSFAKKFGKHPSETGLEDVEFTYKSDGNEEEP